jgi:hypothetical protein
MYCRSSSAHRECLPSFLEAPADHELAVFQDLRLGAAFLVENQLAGVGVPVRATVHRCARGFGSRGGGGAGFGLNQSSSRLIVRNPRRQQWPSRSTAPEAERLNAG